jgi:large subunit ribosomal protein L21
MGKESTTNNQQLITPTRVKKIIEPKASNKSLAPKTIYQYAVFTTGGKQYRVKVGDRVKIEKLNDTSKEGDRIVFNQVLLTDNGASEITLGNPFISGREVKATLNKIGRYKTVDVIKYKQKSRYFKKYGHRQPYFEIIVDSIK